MEKLSEFLREAWEIQRPNLNSAISIACGDENRPVYALIAEIEELEAKADCNDFENWCAAVRGDADAPEPMKQIIEKYCLRLPVDSDGKPWNIGDKFQAKLGGYKEKTVAGFSIYENTAYLISEGGNSYPLNCCSRPQDPVLAADGLPIEVGQTVYTQNGDSGTVASVHRAGEKPAPYTPLSDIPFIRYGSYDCGKWNYADEVTHTPPDSWELLLADMESNTDPVDKDYARRIRALREKEQA